VETDSRSAIAELSGTYIEKQLNRVNRNLLLYSAAFLALVAAFIVGHLRYFYNFLNGPFPADAASLLKIKNPYDEQRYFVRIQGDKQLATGLRDVERQTDGDGHVQSEEAVSAYYLLVLGDKFLVVRRELVTVGTEYEGAIIDLPYDVSTPITRQFRPQYPSIDNALLPVMLDATGFRDMGNFWLKVASVALLLFLLNLARYTAWERDPWAHLVLRKLSRYGSVAQIARQIDQELRELQYKLSETLLTASWILHPRLFFFSAMRIEDVVEASRFTKWRRFGHIPIVRAHFVLIKDRFGCKTKMWMGDRECDDFLAMISRKAPVSNIESARPLNLG
jgi:hypothetical protein